MWLNIFANFPSQHFAKMRWVSISKMLAGHFSKNVDSTFQKCWQLVYSPFFLIKKKSFPFMFDHYDHQITSHRPQNRCWRSYSYPTNKALVWDNEPKILSSQDVGADHTRGPDKPDGIVEKCVAKQTSNGESGPRRWLADQPVHRGRRCMLFTSTTC